MSEDINANVGKTKVMIVTYKEGTALTPPKTEILSLDEFNAKGNSDEYISFRQEERIEFLRRLIRRIEIQEIAEAAAITLLGILQSVTQQTDQNSNDPMARFKA